MENTSIKDLIQKTKEFVQTDKFQLLVAYLPLFFAWVPVLAVSYQKEHIRKACLNSCLFTGYFLAVTFGSIIIGYIPFIGQILGWLLHFAGILGYVGGSFFFLYSEWIEKSIDFSLVAEHRGFLDKYFQQ